MIQVLGTVVLSVANSCFYRMGGSGAWPRWTRHVGISLTQTAVLALLGYIHWTLILSAGAIYGLSTTYFKRKGTDAAWINWIFVGLAFSIAVLPVVLVYHNWLGFSVRTVICTFLVAEWSELQDNVVWEECGRGLIPIITLPLLLI